MLSRVARQKNALFHFRQSIGRRTLPPALRPHSHLNRPLPSEPTRRSPLNSSRNLATTTDQSPVDQGSSYVPIEESPFSVDQLRSAEWNSLFPPQPQEFDGSSLIIMDDVVQTKPKILRKIKGIGGDEEEMLANLDISLKVGQFDRAATLVTRLATHFPVGSPEYLAIHNRYLDEMVNHMIVTRQHSMVLPIQRWFELDMPHGGVKPDARTYAIMIRMALRLLHGTKRDRSVRRYWELAKRDGVEEDVLAVPVLAELELGEVSQICSADLQRVAISSIDMQKDSELGDLGKLVPEVVDTAEVLPVEQRGLGLSSLKRSLSLFSKNTDIPYPSNAEYTAEENAELYNQLRQRQIESDSIQSALDRWRLEFEEKKKNGLDITAGGKRLGSTMNQWHADLVTRISEELKLVRDAEANPIRTRAQKERCEYGVYLRSLNTDRLAALTILGVISTFSRDGMDKGCKLATIVSTIGKDLQDELIAGATMKKNENASARRLKALKQIFADRKQGDGWSQWKKVVKNLEQEDNTVIWPPRVVAQVGAVLMSMLFEVAKAPVKVEDPDTKKQVVTLQPAFQHAYQISWGRRSGLIHIHPAIVKLIAKEPTSDFLARHLPMVCKPKPWKGVNDGAYFVYRSNLIRSTPGEKLQPAYIKAALENDGLKEIRTALDNLGGTGWTINPDVFSVMLEAWNSGEAVAKIAPLEPNLDPPPKPDPEEGYQAERNWHQAIRELENKRSAAHSIRCFQNFQMEVARAYKNETFYLPHNLDFRGRAYPLPPYLNQMGADNARGLLLFSEGKPLGESGMKWLKVQLANLYGFDKASISEREKFTTDNIDNVLDSANNGLHGKRWWLEAEDPWQCLAACCEVRNALNYSDPTQYPSRLPIHQDGSCNGLQHYAALGGDKAGAEQVNLEPSDRPSDVYTGVAEFVKEAVAREAAEGDETAKLLDGKITRKVVKQTVMTNVYGVTFMGAMLQVRKQLIDHYPELSNDQKRDGSLYIARKIFEALGAMFNGAHEIQHWLGDCASRITQSLSPEQIDDIANQALLNEKSSDKKKDASEKFRSTVIWTTPLGLPVVQPYRTRKSRRVSTSLQDLSIVDYNSEDVVTKRKQLQAFPPNFIHSLDATHMIMSANACNRAGLTFSAVHDSFWTHAGDIDAMSRILREAFVRMHSDDVIARLYSEFKVRYGNNIFLGKVDSTSRIGRVIKSHRKKGSKVKELLEESTRQKLLKSDDPEQQERGRQMLTAARIFEEMGGDHEELVIQSSLGETAVGHVPEDMAAAERRLSKAGVDTSDPAIASLFSVGMLDTSIDAGDKSSDVEASGEVDEEGQVEEEPKKKKKKTPRTFVWLWLPMKFRKVPEKGSWDLTRIRDSRYFFS